jgi:hypothetical protein
MKALIACAALLSLGASEPTFTPASVPGSPIVQVKCLGGSGTAFRIGPQEIASVNHVTSLGGCFIDGEAINVSYHRGDFSIVTPKDVSDSYLTVNCGGFVKGRRYVATGYARGLNKLQDVQLTGTGTTMGPFAILSGVFTVIPGMSGGPVIDPASGEAVGTINIYNYPAGLSGSVPFKDTPLCQHS